MWLHSEKRAPRRQPTQSRFSPVGRLERVMSSSNTQTSTHGSLRVVTRKTEICLILLGFFPIKKADLLPKPCFMTEELRQVPS